MVGARHYGGRIVLRGEFGHSEANGYVELFSFMLERVLFHGGSDLLGDHQAIRQAGCLEDQGEFLASKTAEGVGLAYRLLDRPGRCLQHQVAHGMAVGIVESLEIVYVQDRHTECLAVYACMVQCFVQVLVEEGAVAGLCQRVGYRLVVSRFVGDYHPFSPLALEGQQRPDDQEIDYQ